MRGLGHLPEVGQRAQRVLHDPGLGDVGRDASSQRLAGMSRRATPYRPVAAAIVEASTASGEVTTAQPAGRKGPPRLKYAVQLLEPRRNAVADAVPVVVAACSTYGRKSKE